MPYTILKINAFGQSVVLKPNERGRIKIKEKFPRKGHGLTVCLLSTSDTLDHLDYAE